MMPTFPFSGAPYPTMDYNQPQAPEQVQAPPQNDFRMSDTLGYNRQGPQGFDFGANLRAGEKKEAQALNAPVQMAYAQQEMAKVKITQDPIAGTLSIENLPSSVAHSLLGAKKQQDELQQIYQQTLQRNLAQQENIRQHPFLNTLSQLAASFAANDPNPYTRSIGQAATRLNPTLPELQQQQMGVMHQQRQGATEQAELGLRASALAESAANRRTSLQRQGVEDYEKHVKNFVEPYKTAAEARTPPPPFEQFASEFGKRVAHATFDDARTEWEKLNAIASGRAKTWEDEKNKEKDIAIARAKEMIPVKAEEARKVADAKIPAALKLVDARNKAIEKRMNHRAAVKLEADTLGQLAHIDAKSSTQLIALRDMDEFTSNLQTVVGIAGKYKQLTGGIAGLLTDKLPTFLAEEDRQVLQHILSVEKKRIIDFGKAGVRGWAPGEASISKLGVVAQATPEAATKIIGEIKRQIALERKSIAYRYKYAPWHEMPEMLGGMNSPIYQEAAPISQEYFNKINQTFEQQGQSPATAPPKQKRPWE